MNDDSNGTRFQATRNPDDKWVQCLADLEPQNPFYTPQYMALIRERASEPWLLCVNNGDELLSGCTAALSRSRRRRTLEIASVPNVSHSAAFWDGLTQLCANLGITHVNVQSFGSRTADIPTLGRETGRNPRREYVLNLKDPSLFKKMRKGHGYCVKKARKAGVVVCPTDDPAAFETHVRLIDASMARRLQRGENVSMGTDAQPYLDIAKSGAGRLFQAVLDGEPLSSALILRAKAGGYNHSQGTSPKGMDLGVAHFMIHEVACALREEGLDVFNLGGAHATETGLIRFKTGFGGGLETFDLEAANFVTAGFLRRLFVLGTGILGRR